MKGLKLLIDQIGHEPARYFLMLVQDQVKQDHQELLHYLYQGQWQQAADKAHYLKATANIYASENLMKYYSYIMKNTSLLGVKPLFIDTLSQELQQVEDDIQCFLDI